MGVVDDRWGLLIDWGPNAIRGHSTAEYSCTGPNDDVLVLEIMEY